MRTGVSLAAVAVSLMLAGSALAVAEGKAFFVDNFSKPSKNWRTGTFSYGSAAFHSGKFRIAVKPGKNLWDVARTYWPDVKSETVTVDVMLVSGNRHNNMGVQCVWNSANYYAVLMGSDGVYGVLKVKDSKRTVLLRDTNKKPVHPTGVNHIRADCTSSGSITLTVNGTRVFSTVDKHPIGDFSEAGIFAATYPGGGATIDFDNFKAVGK